MKTEMKTLSELNALQAEWMALNADDKHAPRVLREMDALTRAGHISVSRDGLHGNVYIGNQPQFIRGVVPIEQAITEARRCHVRTDVAWHPGGKWVALERGLERADSINGLHSWERVEA